MPECSVKNVKHLGRRRKRHAKQRLTDKISHGHERSCGVCLEPITERRWTFQKMRCCSQDICTKCILQITKVFDNLHDIRIKCPFCREISLASTEPSDIDTGGKSILKMFMLETCNRTAIIKHGCNDMACTKQFQLKHTLSPFGIKDIKGSKIEVINM